MPKKESRSHLLVQVVEQSPAPIMVTDASGKIEFVNPAFTKNTGYLLKDLRGKNPRFLKSGKTPKRIYEELWKTILSGGIWEGEICNKMKNGHLFWETISIASMKDEKGNVTHFVGVWQNITEKKKAEKRLKSRMHSLEHESRTDGLTGQYNHSHILVELEKEVERALRYQRNLAGMMVDIDDFKFINDTYGHVMGDRVIKAFATVLEKSIRKIDILGRYGGDEFIVVLPEATLDIAKLVARRVQKNLEEYQNYVLQDLAPLTTSIGLISFKDIKEVDKNIFIEQIDQALLRAKKSGKNKIVVG